MIVRLTLAALSLIVGLGVSPAHAGDPAGHWLPHGSAPPGLGLLFLALTALCLLVAGRRGRRLTVLALALLVGLSGLEAAVHSVHHFADPGADASCAVLSASPHAADGAATAEAGDPTWTTEPLPAAPPEQIRSLHAFRPHQGRAPPSPSSV
jgi:hypothetical protein